MPDNDRDSVVYVAPDKMGGIVTNIVNARSEGDARRFDYRVLLVHNVLSVDTVFSETIADGKGTRVNHALPIENQHSVLRRLRRALPPGEGVLVATDWAELALVSRHDTRRAVFHVLAGDYDYYYDMAVTHEPVIDVFITVSRSIGERLSKLLPHRAQSIHVIPYGVLVSDVRHARPRRGPLRVVYSGRLDVSKGILDLPDVDSELRALGVSVEWTIVGDGPDASKLRELVAGSDRFHLVGLSSREQTLSRVSECDVFMLPSRAEGLPIAMLEAMGLGVVPVVTDLPGPAEVVAHGTTGFRAPVGDVAAFAAAVAELARDPNRLETMSEACRELVAREYSLSRQVAAYESLFARWRELKRPWPGPLALPYTSRLDRRWIPNSIVKLVRSHRRPEVRPFLRSAKLGVEPIAMV